MKQEKAKRSCWLFFSRTRSVIFLHRRRHLTLIFIVDRSALRWGQLSAGANKSKIEKRALLPLNNTVLFIMITIGSIFYFSPSLSTVINVGDQFQSRSFDCREGKKALSRESNFFMNYFSHFSKLHVTKCSASCYANAVHVFWSRHFSYCAPYGWFLLFFFIKPTSRFGSNFGFGRHLNQFSKIYFQ